MQQRRVAIDLSVLIDLADKHPFTWEAFEKCRGQFGAGCFVIPYRPLAELELLLQSKGDSEIVTLARRVKKGLKEWHINLPARPAAGSPVFTTNAEKVVDLLNEVLKLELRMLLTSDPDVIAVADQSVQQALVSQGRLAGIVWIVSPGMVNAFF